MIAFHRFSSIFIIFHHSSSSFIVCHHLSPFFITFSSFFIIFHHFFIVFHHFSLVLSLFHSFLSFFITFYCLAYFFIVFTVFHHFFIIFHNFSSENTMLTGLGGKALALTHTRPTSLTWSIIFTRMLSSWSREGWRKRASWLTPRLFMSCCTTFMKVRNLSRISVEEN